MLPAFPTSHLTVRSVGNLQPDACLAQLHGTDMKSALAIHTSCTAAALLAPVLSPASLLPCCALQASRQLKETSQIDTLLMSRKQRLMKQFRESK